jgi:putative intracellular protease/amidase
VEDNPNPCLPSQPIDRTIGFAIRDGNLVTGQQNFSGSETAELILETLGR